MPSTSSPAGVTMVVAGDLDGLDVPALVETALSGWGSGGRERARYLDRRATLAGDRSRIVLVVSPRIGADRDRGRSARPGSLRRGRLGSLSRCWVSCSADRPTPASTRCCARRRATPTASARASGRDVQVASSSRPDRCARTPRPSRLRLLVELLESGSAGFSDKEIRSGVDFISKTAPGRYATSDAIADEAVGMALDGRTTEFVTSNLRDLRLVDARRVDAAYADFARRAGIGADRPGARLDDRTRRRRRGPSRGDPCPGAGRRDRRAGRPGLTRGRCVRGGARGRSRPRRRRPRGSAWCRRGRSRSWHRSAAPGRSAG